ncbi:MAG: FAD-binding protein [Actinomycetota bacterium]|nr:FAD-binding protein [Actinomycetota bacterium]
MGLQAVRDVSLDLLGPDGVSDSGADLRSYSCDGLTGWRETPGLVVLPRTTRQVATIVSACARNGVPFVARGSGTGLSGGALPDAGGVLIVTARMRQIVSLSPEDRTAVVEPGVTNAAISAAAAPHGLYYAPDPSSQIVCSIGGNVAENSGGAHCLKYGFTTNHVLGMEVVLPDGTVTWLGGESWEAPGYDLRGVFIGSEGTLGIATKVAVRLLPIPESVSTLVADFPSPAAAGEAVTSIVAAGIVPAAVEMLDHLAIQACEAATNAGFTLTAGAALIVELDGPAADCEASFDLVRQHCTEAGATGIRVAADAVDRATIWRGRKAAFAAAGRLSPSYFVQDGVIPRTALGTVLERIAALAAEEGLRVANVFHAGDGNLHPLVLYDPAVEGQHGKADRLATRIVEICVQEGGSITGEHGVGVDKACSMPKMFTPDDLAAMRRVRDAFDPAGIANPGKVFPTPRLCGDRPGPYTPHPAEVAGLAERM